MEREIHIRRTYDGQAQGTYVRVPFDVPPRTDRIEIEYTYPRYVTEERTEGLRRQEANIVDLGLYDGAGRLRGWSGSERMSVSISASSATPGYAAGPVDPGRWAVTLGLYKISGSVEVRITIRVPEKREVLLAGDLHVHTVNSDGTLRTPEIVELSRRAGLDFVALTDHNSTRQNEEIGAIDGITVIPGMEYTNYRGHANFFFPDGRRHLDCDPLSNNVEEMMATLTAARASGAVVCLNHTHCDLCPWTFGFDGFPYDLVEVWNGTAGTGDARARAWWHERLAAGAQIFIVGGSDFHRHEVLRTVGAPSTFVYAASRSPGDIMAGLVAGRSFVAFSSAGPRLDLRIGGTGLGQRAPEGGAGSVEVRGVRMGDRLVLLDARGTAREWTVPFDGEFFAAFDARREGRFYRLEAWRRHPAGVDLLVALSNPVFTGPAPKMR
jgi:hypothetical protein